MKRKQIIIGIIVVLCAGLGIYALIKSHGAASASDEEETDAHASSASKSARSNA